MGSFGLPWLWAQATGIGPAASPGATAFLALRRWCGSLTLTPSRPVPEWDVVWILAAAPALLALLAAVFQGPGTTLRQLLDIPGHARLIREGVTRVWRAGRMVTILLAFTVLSWTGGLSLDFVIGDAERNRSDLLLLTRSRGPVELVLEHGALAAATPLRDVAGLADNLPLLAAAVAIAFSASAARPSQWKSSRRPAPRLDHDAPFEEASIWRSAVATCGILYILYRLFARISGTGELPVGNCLILEVAIIPALMLVCDGFILGWVLTELRDGGPADDQAGRIDVWPALTLMPATCLVCLAALPARYAATTILLATQHLPTSLMATELGRFVRWGLGPGLVLLQGLSLTMMGIGGVAAWGCGSIREAFHGFGRLLAREGGRLAAVAILSGLGCGVLSALAYGVLFLLPPAGWVLPAADSYAHYASLPIGLWTLAALVLLAERSLPTARLADSHAPLEAEDAPIGEAEVDPL